MKGLYFQPVQAISISFSLALAEQQSSSGSKFLFLHWLMIVPSPFISPSRVVKYNPYTTANESSNSLPRMCFLCVDASRPAPRLFRWFCILLKGVVCKSSSFLIRDLMYCSSSFEQEEDRDLEISHHHLSQGNQL